MTYGFSVFVDTVPQPYLSLVTLDYLREQEGVGPYHALWEGRAEVALATGTLHSMWNFLRRALGGADSS